MPRWVGAALLAAVEAQARRDPSGSGLYASQVSDTIVPVNERRTRLTIAMVCLVTLVGLLAVLPRFQETTPRVAVLVCAAALTRSALHQVLASRRHK